MVLPKANWPCPKCGRSIGVYYADATNRDKVVFIDHYTENGVGFEAPLCTGSGMEFSIHEASRNEPNKTTSARKPVSSKRAPAIIAPTATMYTTCGRCRKRVMVVHTPTGARTEIHTFTSSKSECAGSNQLVSFKDVH